ncbi:hypothetical protein PUNSTDRAFT_118212 [Punctularia strigosozonata HHB-11173 SS5]|uniref:uncharacterized protein n=1 Tax=Punctularia strigosozonata (strain HHB-11173) TaxID=741275 RepID=UPI000441814C|nr:uncharacterized protein PUNSTDRAFT_118212 [Punctularia strigosozonata HHB-11173 SS5]EIN12312.1 hypothetical protein PUNSTDRAFT_118212 [Punctularia strigosozonata HHB-11173 SS5]
MSELIPKPQNRKSRKPQKTPPSLTDILDQLHDEIIDNWTTISYDIRRTLQKHLDPEKLISQQDAAAINACLDDICTQYPIFRRYEDAWPACQYVEQYLFWNLTKNRLQGQACRWRQTMLMCHRSYPSYRRRIRLSLTTRRPVRSCRKLDTITRKRSQAESTDSNIADRAENESSAAPRLQGTDPPQEEQLSVSALPTLGSNNTRRHLRAYVGKLRPSPSAFLPRGKSTASEGASLSADAVDIFLSNLNVPMSHLSGVFHGLGVSDEARLDELTRWDAIERNSWLDAQLLLGKWGEITPFELQVVKRALIQRGEWLGMSEKEHVV